MLFVHGLMGDARAGRGRPGGVERRRRGRLRRRSRRTLRATTGPTAWSSTSPDRLAWASRGRPTIKVLSASGAPCRTCELTLTRRGRGHARRRLDRRRRASRRVAVHAATAPTARRSRRRRSRSPRRCRASTPRPTRPPPRTDSGWPRPTRRRSPGRRRRPRSRRRRWSRRPPIRPRPLLGGTVSDRVDAQGRRRRFQATVTARALRPVPLDRRDPLRRPAGVGGLSGRRTAPATTRPRRCEPTEPGWYVYRQSVPGTPAHVGHRVELHRPARAREGDRAAARAHAGERPAGDSPAPRSPTSSPSRASAARRRRSRPRCTGPFPSRDAINCDGTPVWTGTVEANGDGEYRTEPFKVHDARLLHVPREPRRERVRARRPRRRASTPPRRRSCPRRRRS